MGASSALPDQVFGLVGNMQRWSLRDADISIKSGSDVPKDADMYQFTNNLTIP